MLILYLIIINNIIALLLNVAENISLHDIQCQYKITVWQCPTKNADDNIHNNCNKDQSHHSHVLSFYHH